MTSILFAQAVASAEKISEATRTFEFGRIEQPIDWVLPVLALLAILTFAWFVYLKDCAELHWSLAMLLAGLRTAAFVGLFWVLLDPRYRVERVVQQDSRVLVLMDTSLSMGLSEDQTGSASPGPTRTEQVQAMLKEAKLIEKLRRAHEVIVIRFDQEKQVVHALNRIPLPKDGKPLADELARELAMPLDWEKLRPQGRETRLGESLRDIINDHRAAPLSAVAVFTDGQQNVGISPASAIDVAIDAKIPVYTIGLGSTREPVNVRVADFIAPARAHKGDDFVVNGYIQGRGMAGQNVVAEIFSRPAGAKPGTNEALEGTEQIVLGADGEPANVRFKLPAGEVGRKNLILRIRPPEKDTNKEDNSQEADVEIVDRKLRVLLFAGGPAREYQFLRNQLFRDPDVLVDVLLQSATQGISQEADKILDTFPSNAAELAEYDAIVAFDPDWRKLTTEQVDLLDAWVAEQAGGLIVVAGPVYTEDWSMAGNSMSKIRAMYPVEFNKQFALLNSKRFENKEAWPITLTPDGLQAEFLWLTEDAVTSNQAWKELEGVYGYYSVRGKKAGATAYGVYSDPNASDGENLPVYFAGHFYGSGRVFYEGSAEMWRANAVDLKYFERFYTRLIRHVSQGRVVRGSKRGTLLVERDRYLLGDNVAVRAQLSDHELKPLQAEHVMLEVVAPDNSMTQVKLSRDRNGRQGSFLGQFAVRQERTYRLELKIPDAPEEEALSRRIEVRVPDLERENPQRNDALLASIASQTGGKYYPAGQGLADLLELLPAAPRTTVLTEAPIPLWDNMKVLMILCCMLFAEWLIRKLAKLA